MLEAIMFANTMRCSVSSIDRQFNRYAARHYRLPRWIASTIEDAGNAITMHSECKTSAEHHQGTRLNDKGQSVHRDHVRSQCAFRAKHRRPNLSSSDRRNTRICALIPNTITCNHAIMTIVRTIHQLYIFDTCAHVRYHAPPPSNPPRFS